MMPTPTLPFDWVAFGAALRGVRAARSLTIRGAVEQVPGLSLGTWTRLENGSGCHTVPIYLTVCRWMDLSPFECMDICECAASASARPLGP